MKEFAFGTDKQFAALDQELSIGRKYKFANRKLPDCCTQNTACIWFSKENGNYCIYITNGITTNSTLRKFNDFLECGKAVFPSMEEMKGFLHSLQILYHQPNAVGEVVDTQKLKKIRENQQKPKTVFPEELAEPLKKKVFGQDNILDALADKVVISQMRKNKRLLTIALLGLTATGKSETAKSLAEVMSEVYGIPYGFIEIAGSELIGEHSVHRFFGAPPGYVGHGQATVLEPVRKNPHHVIVINEIEKANEKTLVGLMEAIDTGKLGMADNSAPIDLNQCILFFTSNIPIEREKYEKCSDFERAEMCRDAFTKHCGRPEISGKIGNFLVFNPLSDEANVNIIIKFIREELESYDLTLESIEPNLMADFLNHQTKYGARGIRVLVNDSVGRHLIRTRKFEEIRNKRVSLSGTIDHIEFKIA